MDNNIIINIDDTDFCSYKPNVISYIKIRDTNKTAKSKLNPAYVFLR